MIQVKELGPSTYRTLPWKNHRGTTSEICIFPEDMSFHTDPFLWRVSSARISSSGSFSLFPGYDRTILVIDGKGAELNHQQAEEPKGLKPLEPYQFRGEWDTTIEIGDQSVRDFNLMARRGKVSASLDVVLKPGTGRASVTAKESDVLLYCVGGRAEVAGGTSGTRTIGKKDSLHFRLEPGDRETWTIRAIEPDTAVIAVQASVLPSPA